LFLRGDEKLCLEVMKTALVIDDDPGFRKMLNAWLSGAGWRVIEASEGEAGVGLAMEHHPDAVICDLLMPGCNGFQVCRLLRGKGEQIKQPKIVVTTGSGYLTDQQNAYEAGADEYMVKPFNAADLLRLLDRPSGGHTTVFSTRREPPRNTVVLPQDYPAHVRFWGVRGSIPTPGPSTVQYGGNTSCVEVRADGEIIILDAGSGIRPLGLALSREFKDLPIELTLLITHTHWDHIQGFPFFVPAYNPQNKLRIVGFDGARKGLLSTLTSQMESPYFPVAMRHMPGNIDVTELKELNFEIGRVRVQAAFVNHPGVCVGYRLFTSNGSIAYLPDNEPFQRMRACPGAQGTADRIEALKYASEQDQKIIDFVRDAAVLIIDAQYDDEEYRTHSGWGHGCVDDVVALALFAKVKQLFLFHHDPDHDDAQISRMRSWARQLVAMQGETLAVDAACEGVEYVLKQPQPVPAGN
jgi:phosphoribosyl 1,2-cyclic phosphodiesterase/ActR/RegA family two-component response regulator